MTDNEKELVATIKLSLLRAVVDLDEETLAMAIRVPKSEEPSEDCVSRQALINAFPISDTYTLDDIIATIKFQSPVTPIQKWIPVSERLPKEDEVVLGTNLSNDLFETNTWNDCGEIKWYANGCFDVPVIAWMPLPEPYKEVEE